MYFSDVDWIVTLEDGVKIPCSKQAFGLLYEPVTCSNPCVICGKEMVQVDLDLWKCPNYPHIGDECADDFVFSSKEPSTVTPIATSDLYCVGCGKPKVLCLGGTPGCNE